GAVHALELRGVHVRKDLAADEKTRGDKRQDQQEQQDPQRAVERELVTVLELGDDDHRRRDQTCHPRKRRLKPELPVANFWLPVEPVLADPVPYLATEEEDLAQDDTECDRGGDRQRHGDEKESKTFEPVNLHPIHRDGPCAGNKDQQAREEQ